MMNCEQCLAQPCENMCIMSGTYCTLRTNDIEFLVYSEYSYSVRTPGPAGSGMAELKVLSGSKRRLALMSRSALTP